MQIQEAIQTPPRAKPASEMTEEELEEMAEQVHQQVLAQEEEDRQILEVLDLIAEGVSRLTPKEIAGHLQGMAYDNPERIPKEK